MTIDDQGRRLWQRFQPAQRAAFFSCLLAGWLVHLYALTNLIPNPDGLSRVFDPQQMTISGRWFLHYASSLNGYTQMPAAIGLLSLLFLGIAAALTVELLSIRSSVLGGLTGVMMAVFPSLGFIFLYMFTASAYCLSILLAVLSVWLARRGRLGWLLGVLVLALSMGIYQAYVTMAISLSLLLVLRTALDPASTFHSTLRLGLRLMAYLAAGALLYYLILIIFLRMKDLELLSYLGMDAASAGYPIGQLPHLIVSAYRQVAAFLLFGFSSTHRLSLLTAANLLLALCAAGMLAARLLRRQGLETWRLLGALAMLALLPLGVNFGRLLSPYADPTPIMKYAFVALYLAVLLLADWTDRADFLPPAPLRLLAPAAAVCLLLFCLNTNNLLYTASAQAHRATESYLTRLLARVEACPGYESGMEIAVVGAIPPEQLQAQIPSYASVDHYSVPMGSVAPLNKHIYQYFRDWLNVPVSEPSEAVMQSISDSPEFQAMPLYPADGSIQILDGRAVVRLQPRYTPKSDFEIAYENRR